MQFAYENGKTIANIKSYGASDVVQFHACTGTHIVLMNVDTCRILTGYSNADIKRFINNKSTDLTYQDLTGKQIKIVPVILKDIVIGVGNDEAMTIPEFKVFLTSENILWNILGMDFLSACSASFDNRGMTLHELDDRIYHSNFVCSCNGHRIYEIGEIMSDMSSGSLWEILKSAEGNSIRDVYDDLRPERYGLKD